jgi:hypothetical protein
MPNETGEIFSSVSHTARFRNVKLPPGTPSLQCRRTSEVERRMGIRMTGLVEIRKTMKIDNIIQLLAQGLQGGGCSMPASGSRSSIPKRHEKIRCETKRTRTKHLRLRHTESEVHPILRLA